MPNATVSIRRRSSGEVSLASTELLCVRMSQEHYDHPLCALSIQEHHDNSGKRAFSFGTGPIIHKPMVVTLAHLHVGDVAYVKERAANVWWPCEIVSD